MNNARNPHHAGCHWGLLCASKACFKSKMCQPMRDNDGSPQSVLLGHKLSTKRFIFLKGSHTQLGQGHGGVGKRPKQAPRLKKHCSLKEKNTVRSCSPEALDIKPQTQPLGFLLWDGVNRTCVTQKTWQKPCQNKSRPVVISIVTWMKWKHHF